MERSGLTHASYAHPTHHHSQKYQISLINNHFFMEVLLPIYILNYIFGLACFSFPSFVFLNSLNCKINTTINISDTYIYQPLHIEQDVTQGQFLSRVILIWIQLSFPFTGSETKAKEPNRPY